MPHWPACADRRSHTALVGAPKETTPAEGNLAIRKKINHVCLGSENSPVKGTRHKYKEKSTKLFIAALFRTAKTGNNLHAQP